MAKTKCTHGNGWYVAEQYQVVEEVGRLRRVQVTTGQWSKGRNGRARRAKASFSRCMDPSCDARRFIYYGTDGSVTRLGPVFYEAQAK